MFLLFINVLSIFVIFARNILSYLSIILNIAFMYYFCIVMNKCLIEWLKREIYQVIVTWSHAFGKIMLEEVCIEPSTSWKTEIRATGRNRNKITPKTHLQWLLPSSKAPIPKVDRTSQNTTARRSTKPWSQNTYTVVSMGSPQ